MNEFKICEVFKFLNGLLLFTNEWKYVKLIINMNEKLQYSLLEEKLWEN